MTTLNDLDTPCLILDRARLERNAAAMRQRCATLGVTLRPHVKTPKSVQVARVTQGSEVPGPITVSTLQEAAYFARQGFEDILLAVAIVPAKIERLLAIQRETGARVRVVLDSVEAAAGLAGRVQHSAMTVDVLIEIDCGEHRSGVTADDPALLAIARSIDGAQGLALAGVMTHAGHSYGTDDVAELRRIAGHERDTACAAADRLRSAGFAAPIVSVGSTPTIQHAQHLSGVTEARCGIYAFWDLAQASRRICTLDEIAVTVLATVIGHNRQGSCLIVDAGALALSKDIGAIRFMPEAGYGLVCDAATAAPLRPLAVTQVHQEHGTIAISDAGWFERLPIGSLVRIMPNHACLTCAAYEAYHVVEGDRVVDVWGRINGW